MLVGEANSLYATVAIVNISERMMTNCTRFVVLALIAYKLPLTIRALRCVGLVAPQPKNSTKAD